VLSFRRRSLYLGKPTPDQLDEILNTFNWIKVKKYEDDPTKTWEERFRLLETHHVKETTFMIKKIREFAALLKE
jgi:hypothetical protein